MELKGSTFVRQPIDKVWAALNNEEILRQCITGCESLERVDDQSMSAKLAVKIGPVRARFNGKVSMSDVIALQGYTLNFEGSGGAAGFAKGSSQVALHEENAGTRIDYTAQASIGGKLGQVGGRMIDATARSMADDFFAAFSNCLGPAAIDAGVDGAAQAQLAGDRITRDASAADGGANTDTNTDTDTNTIALTNTTSGFSTTGASTPLATPASAAARPPHSGKGAALPPASVPAGSERLTWFIAGMIVSALLMLLGKHFL